MKPFYKSLQVIALASVLVLASSAMAKTSSRKARRPAQSTTATPAMLRNKIVFSRRDDVWMVDPETRRERMLFKNPFWERAWSPYYTNIQDMSFSPDLKRVVFTHDFNKKEGQFTGNELFLMNLDGNGKKQLTNTNRKHFAREPRFSPDGRQIVYTHESGSRMGGPGFATVEIRVVNADGTNDRHVIGNFKDRSQGHANAFWSRDGKRLLFTHYLANIAFSLGTINKENQEMQTCALDGSDVQPFDGDYSAFLHPSVSPDAKFRATSEPAGLRLLTPQNKLVRDLETFADVLGKTNPQWSGDGKRVVFEATQQYTVIDQKGNASAVQDTGVWLIGSDGKGLRRIVNNNASLLTWLH